MRFNLSGFIFVIFKLANTKSYNLADEELREYLNNCYNEHGDSVSDVPCTVRELFADTARFFSFSSVIRIQHHLVVKTVGSVEKQVLYQNQNFSISVKKLSKVKQVFVIALEQTFMDHIVRFQTHKPFKPIVVLQVH